MRPEVEAPVSARDVRFPDAPRIHAMSDRLSQSSYLSSLSPPMGEEDVVEIPLLLPGWQVSALATAAHDRGLTTGEMVRTLLRQFIADCQKETRRTVKL
jgi:hypothetical protein